mmetsp:Transcript_47067/g.110034  ORF Transcript_47067/g.110034 Transcript_47067/m.110034 type:complete len:82 (+) Transcript_47067:550-795(+)
MLSAKAEMPKKTRPLAGSPCGSSPGFEGLEPAVSIIVFDSPRPEVFLFAFGLGSFKEKAESGVLSSVCLEELRETEGETPP